MTEGKIAGRSSQSHLDGTDIESATPQLLSTTQRDIVTSKVIRPIIVKQSQSTKISEKSEKQLTRKSKLTGFQNLQSRLLTHRNNSATISVQTLDVPIICELPELQRVSPGCCRGSLSAM